MLKYSEIKPDSIEKLICLKMDSLKDEKMSNELISDLILIMQAQGLIIPESEKPFLFKIIEKRIQHCFTFNIKDHRLLLFMSVLCKSAGGAIMYLWYLQFWCFKNDVKEIDLEMFCEKIFPLGFFSENTLKYIWDMQKVVTEGVRSDNLLDYNFAGESIHFKK